MASPASTGVRSEPRWRCAACEATFASEEASPRCPKCLRRSSVAAAPAQAAGGTADAPAPWAAPAASIADPSAGARIAPALGHERINGVALGFAIVPAICAALLASGWFADFELVLPAALGLALIGAPISGWLAERTRSDRLFATLAAASSALGIVLATTWYVRGRHASGNVELLLPMVLGGLPGLGAFYAFRRLASHPLARVAAAVGLAVAAAAAAAAVAVATA